MGEPDPEQTVGGRQAEPLLPVPALENEELMRRARISAWSVTRVRSESRRRVRKGTTIIAQKPIQESR
jgi:hypothetical protein